jgi:hypothetical protein
LAPQLANAAVTFDMPGATLDAATGEQIIQRFYPSLQGQGLGAEVANALNSPLGNATTLFASQIMSQLDGINFEPFLGGMANAGASAAKTLPVDYASDMTLFSLTAGGGVAVHGVSVTDPLAATPDFTGGTAPELGVGTSMSLLLGINLAAFGLPDIGLIDLARLRTYVSFGSLGYTDTNTGSSFDTSAFALHGQYQFFDQVNFAPGGLLRWGGLSFNSGVNYSKLGISFEGAMPGNTNTQQVNFQLQNQQRTLNASYDWSGQALIGAHINTVSIPFEAATSIQVLYLLTLYGGAGLDLNFGSAEFSAESRNNVAVTLSDSGNPSAAPLQVLNPKPNLRFTQSKGPTFGNLRGFVGLQANLWVLALFAQVNGDTASNLAANAGLRVFW